LYLSALPQVEITKQHRKELHMQRSENRGKSRIRNVLPEDQLAKLQELRNELKTKNKPYVVTTHRDQTLEHIVEANVRRSSVEDAIFSNER
jgi:hypothetical protein